MKNVLYISYLFPPMAGGGVYRVVKTLKYLPAFGWNPSVLTVKNHHHWVTDHTLLKELPLDLTVQRTYCLDPFYLYALLDKTGMKSIRHVIEEYLAIPDNKLGWFLTALIKGLCLIRKNNIDLIFSTSPPHSTHMIAYVLKKITGKPWVAEFRDHMSLNPLRNTVPPLRLAIEKNMEKRFLADASRVITVTEGNRDDIINLFGVEDTKVVVVPNGFDPSDFEGLDKIFTKDRKCFTMTYTGSLYGTRTPRVFLDAVQKILTYHPELRGKFSVNIIGKIEDKFKGLCEGVGLKDVVHFYEFLDHREALSHMINSHILILLISSGGANNNVLTGKIFEYMASGTPILALVPDGIAKRLIEESRTGFTVDPDNAEALSEKIYELYQKWESGKLTTNPNWDVIKRYERKSITQALAAEFDSIVMGS